MADQPKKSGGRFVNSLAIVVVFLSFAYLFCASFLPIQNDNKLIVVTIASHLLGVITMIMSFYYGASFIVDKLKKSVTDATPPQLPPHISALTSEDIPDKQPDK